MPSTDSKKMELRDPMSGATQFGVDDFMELEVDRHDVKVDQNFIIADYVYQKVPVYIF
jgi:hypothetical protein